MEMRPVTSLAAMRIIGRGVFIELLRRKDLFVLMIMMTVFAMGAVAGRMVGIENAATATFILNLGLSLAYLAAHLLTMGCATRQIPSEIENRTLYTVLARPITRSCLLLGKWAACTLCGFGVFGVLAVLGWMPVPKLESYDSVMLLQMVLMQGISLGVLAAMGLVLGCVVPKGVAWILCLALFLGGDGLAAAARSATGGSWLAHYLPAFPNWNLITRLTDGVAALDAGQLFGLAAHGVLFSALFLLAGAWVLDRRAL